MKFLGDQELLTEAMEDASSAIAVATGLLGAPPDQLAFETTILFNTNTPDGSL